MYRSLETAVPKRKGCFLPNRSFAQRFLFIALKGLQSMRPLVFYMSEIQPVISFIISRIEGIALVWRLFPIASI